MQSFIDTATITVQAGSGGDGAVSLRHEKYIPKGGPDGGDGGDGGSVYFQADSDLNTLYTFRHKKNFKAKSGERGGKSNRHGKSAEDVVIKVPVGTQIKIIQQDSKEIIELDLIHDHQMVMCAKGGKGGKGNARFKSSRQQTPRFATPGEPGQVVKVELELKLLADVGLVGQPNAGKSTLLSRISKARPEIANYPFTTIEPNLGIAEYAGDSYVVADIPGLIAGASVGRGLGGQFLKHIERTSVLFHLVSLDPQEAMSPLDRYREVQEEMAQFNPELLEKKQAIILTKVDLVSDNEVSKAVSQFSDFNLPILQSNPDEDGNYEHIIKMGLEMLQQARQSTEASSATDENNQITQYTIDNLPRIYKK